MSDPVQFRREEMEIGKGRKLYLYWFEDGLHAPTPSSSSPGTSQPASDEEGESPHHPATDAEGETIP